MEGQDLKIKCLAEQDILKAVSFLEVMDTVEEAFFLYEKNEMDMPLRTHLDYEGNTLLLMPCFTKEGFGTKLVTVFPENNRYNAPITNGLMMLNKAETGEPLAIINGFVLTAMRTAAVGSVSTRHLAPGNAEVLGLIGTGGQGYYQALFTAKTRKLKDIFLFNRSSEKLDGFVERLEQVLPEVNLHKAQSAEELLEASDIVITATTSKDPVLPNYSELFTGKHFVGIGSFRPDMREYPEALFRQLEKVYIDTGHALAETGDLIVPLEEKWLDRSQVETFGHFLLEHKGNEEIKGKTTFFKSVGMALFDLTVGQLIYQKALEKGLGQDISL